MPGQSQIRVTSSARSISWFLPDPEFPREFVSNQGEAGRQFVAYMIQSVERQIRERLIPYLKRTLPKRTGKLAASINLRRVQNGFQLFSAFYGAFLKPSVRQRIASWVQNEYRGILNQAQREAVARVEIS